MSAEAELARFIVRTRFDKLPRSVVEATKRDIFDTVGTALAGSSAPGSREVVELVQEFGGKEEGTLFVYGGRMPSPEAALANGTMAHALDFDDTHDAAVLHAGVSVVPAAIAVAERLGNVSGKELITAVALGIDVVSRIGLATKCWIGWILTAIYGYYGAAAAAGKLLGLSEERILNALGIAFAQSAGNLECVASGALTKRIQAGFAARGGVLSALMAQKGVTGVKEFLTAGGGVFNLYQRGEYDLEPLTSGLGERFEVTNLSYKPYPCCRWLHTPIDAALALSGQVDPGRIEKIEIEVGQKAWVSVGEPLEAKLRPRNVVDAQFSIPYTVAVALVKGKVKIEDFTEEAIRDARVLGVSGRVTFKVNSDMEKGVGRGISPTRITVRTKDGKTFSAEADTPKGHPRNPMTDAEFEEKFRDCAAHAVKSLAASRVDAAIKMLNGLENVKDVAELTKLLVKP
ncbi:MAG: MmgE/PrpD family protein [Chloroflexota bacterium]